MITSLPTKRILALSQWEHLPTRRRQKQLASKLRHRHPVPVYLLAAKSKCLCSRKTDFQLPVVVKFVVLLFDEGPASNLVVSEVKLS